MSKKTNTTTWEKIFYWPIAKEMMTTPKGRLIIELIDVFGMVITAAFGGMFLAFAILMNDQQGLLFTNSNSGKRYYFIMIGVALILVALGLGVIRRIILAPSTE